MTLHAAVVPLSGAVLPWHRSDVVPVYRLLSYWRWQSLLYRQLVCRAGVNGDVRPLVARWQLLDLFRGWRVVCVRSRGRGRK